MGQIANIVAYDGASTPVIHTLVAISVYREKGVIYANWEEQLPGLPKEAQVRCSLKMETLKSGVWRRELRTETPVMETATNQNAQGYTASPKVAYVETDITVKYSHPRSSETLRKTSRCLHDHIATGEPASVIYASSGPVVAAFDQLIMPT